jgi:hypothetical protein
MRLHALALVTAMAAWATPTLVQTMISAKSGTINYIEGSVSIDQKPVEVKFAQFPQLKNKSLLETTEGRAEILLGDGIFLRIGENSAVRMLSNSLIDTRLELVSGSVVVEWADQEKHDPLTFLCQGATVSLLKRGVYRLDSEPGLVRVYDGEARVVRDDQTVILKKAKQLALQGVAVPQTFDNKTSDGLMRWARRRAEYLSYANVTAAKDAARWGLLGGSSGWVFNPWYGMFTYLPMSGIYNSFWGYSFFSPYSVWNRYYYPTTGGGGGVHHNPTPVYSSVGQTGMTATSSGTSGTARVSSPPSAASSAASSPVSQGSGHAGSGRGH